MGPARLARLAGSDAIALAYQKLGSFNTPIALAIATAKALVVAAVFMELRERRPLIIAFACAGLFWLGILFWLAAADFATRPEFPPKPPGAEVSRVSHVVIGRLR